MRSLICQTLIFTVEYINMLFLYWQKLNSCRFVFQFETVEPQSSRPRGGRGGTAESPQTIAARAVGRAQETMARAVNIDSGAEYAEARELRSELQNRHLDPATRAFYTRNLSIRGTRYTMGPLDWQDVQGSNSLFPPALRAHLEQKDIARMPASINPARNLDITLREDPGLEKLGKWLAEQYTQRRGELAALGVRSPSVQQLTPPDCLKFVTYLMSVVFKNRISGDIAPQASDRMSVLALSVGKQPVVCRNTSQIFKAYIMALQNLQAKIQPGSSPLASMYVRCVSAETSQSAPGIPRGHAWNEVFIKQPDGSIGVLVMDPNWGSQLKGDLRFNYTQERVSFTMMELEPNIQSLVDSTVKGVEDYIKHLDSGEARLTTKAVKSIQDRLDALMFDKRVTAAQAQALVSAGTNLRMAVSRRAATPEFNAYVRSQYETLTQAMFNKTGVRFILSLSPSTKIPSENASPINKQMFIDLVHRGLNSFLLIAIKLYQPSPNPSDKQAFGQYQRDHVAALATLREYRLDADTFKKHIKNAVGFLTRRDVERQLVSDKYQQVTASAKKVIQLYLS